MSKKKIVYEIGFNLDSADTNKLTGSLSKITTSLKNLHNMDIGSFMSKSGIQDLKQAEQQLQLIKTSSNAVGQALAASFNQRLNTYNIQLFNQELKSAGFTIKEIGNLWAQAGNIGTAAFMRVADAATQTQGVARKLTGVFDKLGETLVNTVRWKISSGLIEGVTRSIGEAWGYTKALDSSLNDIRIVTGQSAAQMDKFAKSANNAARKLAASTTAYTNASLIYYQQGLTDKEVEARTKVTIKAANVTGQSAAEVSEQLTAVWNGYKVVAEEAELYVDKLAAVAATTAADLEELSTGMSKVASAANSMGVNIDQLSAQMATIVSVTRQDASLVGTALKTIYARMGDLQVDGVDEFGTSLGDVSGKMRQMGIDILDQEGNLRDMGGVIEEVAKKWGTWTDAQQQAAAVAIAGKRQYNNLIALFENWDMYESSLATSQNAEGTLEEQQKTYKEGIQAMLQEVATAKEGFKGELFDVESIKVVTKILKGIFTILEKITAGLGGLKNILPIILGLVLTLSNKVSAFLVKGIYDIATGIGNIWKRKQIFYILGKDAAMASDNLKKLNGQFNQALQTRISLQKLYSAGLISEEAYETARKYNEALISSQEQLAEAQTKREADDKKINDTGGGDPTISNVAEGVEDTKAYATKVGTTLDELDEKQLQKINKAYGKLTKSLTANTNKVTKSMQTLNKQAGKTQKELNKDFSKNKSSAVNAAKAFAGVKYLTDDQKQQILDLATEMENAASPKKLQSAIRKANGIITDMGNHYVTTNAEMQEEAEKTARGQDNLAVSTKNVAENQKKVEENTQGFKKLQVGMAFTQAAGSVLSFAGAAGGLANTIKGLTSGTADWGEVTAGFITSLLGMIPGVVTGIQLIKGSVDGLNASLSMVLGIVTVALMGVLLLLQLGSSLGWFKKKKKKTEEQKAEEALAEINGTLDTMKENAKETRESMASLKDEISDYREAKKGLDAMREGTDEWRDAVDALNLQVLEMMEKYPELEMTQQNIHGKMVYSLDSASIDAAFAAKQALMNQQNEAIAVQEIRSLQASRRVQQESGKDNLKSAWSDMDNDFEVMFKTDKWQDLLDLNASEIQNLKDTLEEEIKAKKDLSDSERASIYKVMNAIESHQKTLDHNNKLLQKETEDYLKIVAANKNINSDVFSNLADYSTASEGVGVATSIAGAKKNFSDKDDAADFIRHNNDNKFVSIELDENGQIKMSKNEDTGQWEINTKLIDNHVKDKIDNNDLTAVHTWIDSMAKAAYGPNARVDQYGELWDKKIDELGEVEISVNETKMTIAELRQAVYTAAWRQQLERDNERLISYQQKMQASGKSEESAYFSKELGLYNEKTFQWDEGTLAKYDTIIGYGDADTVDNATTERGKFVQAMETALNPLGVTTAAKENSFTQLTMSDIYDLVASVNGASAFGGKSAITSLINSVNDPVQMKKLQELLTGADWTSTEWITSFQVGLHEIGIDITNTDWSTFFDTVNSGMKQWADNSEKVREKLAFIKDTIEDLEVGASISDEDYKQLLSIDPTAAQSFIKGADGWVALESGKQIANQARSKYSDLGAMQTTYSNIRTNAKNVKGTGIQSGQGSNLATLFELAKYFGYNLTFNEEGGLTDISLDNASRATHLTSLLGLQSGSIATLLQEAMNPELRDGVTQNLQKLAKKADQMLIDYETGYYDEESAVDIYATSGISYEEAQTAGAFNIVENVDGTSNSQSVANRQKYFANQFRTQLGVGVDWGTALNVDQIKQIAQDAHKRELDYYAEVEQKLDILDAQLESAFGVDKINLLASSAATAQDKKSIAEAQETAAENFFTSLVTNSSIGSSWYDSNSGAFNLSSALNKQAELAAAGLEDSAEYKEIEKIIEAYEAMNEATVERIEAEQAATDAQLELISGQFELRNSLVEFTKQMNELNEEAEHWTSVASAFGERSITDISSSVAGKILNLDSSKNNALRNLIAINQLLDPNSLNSATMDAFGESLSTLFDIVSEYQEVITELYDTWMDQQDKLMALYDEEIEKFKTLNSVLSSSVEVLKLVNGDATKIKDYYDLSIKSSAASYSFALQKQKEAAEEYETYITNGADISDEMREKIIDNYTTATEELNTAAQEWSNIIVSAFTETVNATISEVYKDAGGLAGVSLAWELENAQDERYLDDVNEAYARDELNRKIQKSIDETDNLSIQNKLAQKRVEIEEQLTKAKEKQGKLTQYDLDRANALYEVELKRIALEEAQQTSNKMKLTRDAMGNYTYQYVADQDAIAKAEEELATAQNELYNLDKDRKKELIDEWFTMMSEYEAKMSEAMATGNEALQRQVHEYYFGANGTLKAIQGGLELIGENNQWLNNIFSGATAKIELVGIGNLGTDLKNIVTSTQASLGSFKESVSTAFGEEGAISTAIGILGSVVDNAEETMSSLTNADGTGLADQLQISLKSVAENLASYVTKVSDLTATLAPYNELYKTTLNTQVQALADNTQAVSELTLSALTLIDALDGDEEVGERFNNDDYDWDADNQMYILANQT